MAGEVCQRRDRGVGGGRGGRGERRGGEGRDGGLEREASGSLGDLGGWMDDVCGGHLGGY